MGYRILADATVVVHFAFLGYVVFGGFLAWRHPRMIWPHLVAAAWGLAIVVTAVDCPLTLLEDWARAQGGQPRLTHGFIDTYLQGVVYPARYTRLLQLLAAGCVLVSWSVPVRRRLEARRAGDPRPGRPHHGHS